MNANRDNHLQQFFNLQKETAATERSQKLIIAELQKRVDAAENRTSGLEHIIRLRDTRIQELETELFALRPPTAEYARGYMQEG